MHSVMFPFIINGKLTIGKVLLVGKDENNSISHLSIIDYPMELLSCFVDAISVGTVYDKDQSLRPSVVVSPQRSNLVLPPHVLKKHTPVATNAL